jgi:putative membrane protein
MVLHQVALFYVMLDDGLCEALANWTSTADIAMKKILSYSIAVIVLIVGTIFAIYNSNVVTLNLVLFSMDMPLAFLLILTLILGAGLGIFASMGMMYRNRRELHKLRKQAKLNKTEINNLRTIPFKD